jgi:alpha-1,2-mannosyltransferase
LALKGSASAAYDVMQHYAAEKVAIGNDVISYYAFHYPPMFLLFLLPFVSLPYFLSLLAWQGVTLAFCLTMIQKVVDRKETLVLALAFPATFITLSHGQSAFLTTGLLCGALYYLDRKRWLAGVMIGFLTIKPHLGILFPFLLILTGRWQVFWSATIAALIFAALSCAIFGLETWQAFIASTSLTSEVLHTGLIFPLYKMQTLFASLRLNGVDLGAAYCAHGFFAAIAAISVLWVWRIGCSSEIKNAAFVTGALLMTPYLLDYDLMLLAIVIACLGAHGIKKGLRPWLITLLATTWLSPILVRPFNHLIPIPWTPILLGGLLYHIVMLAHDDTSNRTTILMPNNP